MQRGRKRALQQLVLMDQCYNASPLDCAAYLVEAKPSPASPRKQPAYRRTARSR